MQGRIHLPLCDRARAHYRVSMSFRQSAANCRICASDAKARGAA